MTPQIDQTHEAHEDIRPKRSKKRIAAALGAAAVALALIAGACSSSDGPEGSEGSGTETSEGPEGSEAGSEGSGSGEASEGGTGQGEAAEAGHGGEGGNGEAAEGGVVNLLTANQTYDETINGARLLLSYDSGANAFTGTVENTTNGPLTRARVEVHLSNGTELGPTTPTGLAPGEVININLPSTAASFDTWSAHPEVGAAEAGGDSAGSEGGSEGSNEGPEGTEGGGQAAGTTTHFTSTGISRGVHASQTLAPGDGYAGKLNDLEVAVSFDAATDTFVGRVKNEANEALCNTTVNVVLDGSRDISQSVLIPSLDMRGRADFVLEAGTASFDTWVIESDTFTCSTVVSDGGEGGEAAGGESGSEGGNEGGSEGSGAESAQESAPPIPVTDPATGTFNSLDYSVAYDETIQAFRGVVTNNTNQIVCGSRLEIHMAVNGNVIELGPTINKDLAPGESLNLVLSAEPITPDTYSLHPESSPCNGQATAAGEGSEGGSGEGSEGAGHETGGNG